MFELKHRVEYREEIKKSRFIAIATPVSSVQEAITFFDENSDSSARHNCWAYKVDNEYRFNDDGEPSGTAGKPILSAIENTDLTNTAVLVIRWFGGIKLGTGGLCRAYGGTASKCLQSGILEEIIEKEKVSISVPFEMSSTLYRFLTDNSLATLKEDFKPEGLSIECEFPELTSDDLKSQLNNLTSGKVKISTSKQAK